MAIPSFTEYMKNKSDIITVQVFPYESKKELNSSEKKYLITLATNEASKCNCIVEVFDKENFAYTNMVGDNERGAFGRMTGGSWGIFVTGAEKSIKKMFGGKNTISTKWNDVVETFAMKGSSFDKKFVVKGRVYA